MIVLPASLIFLSTGILFLALVRNRPQLTQAIFLVSLTAGCAMAFVSAVHALVTQTSIAYYWHWPLPWGRFYIGLDVLSAVFLLPVTLLCFLAGLYGVGYFKEGCLSDKSFKVAAQTRNKFINFKEGRLSDKSFKEGGRKKDLSSHFCLYLVLLLSLVLVVTARNAVLFLLAWEAMSVSSYFLITHYDEKEEVRQAGLLYLVATHVGTFCLWIMFILLGTQAGSMNFDQMAVAQFPMALAGAIFVLAIFGFGVKAGFIPLHIWLPHAHPAAPSHVSAVLSGVMIKMGIYGIIRVIMLVKHFPEWCPVLLLVIGITSGVGGVLYALGQHEIKKLLAYHSIENIGIIALGLGIGLWAQLHQYQAIAAIGYAGALLHVFNHAMFKGLLFLSAGSVIRQTHSGEIDHLGGVMKYLPWTGALFLVGSWAICGLPLFNGFISEWLVYRSLFEGLFSFPLEAVMLIGMAIISLALIGGLALMCFTKAFGAVFLGQGRSSHALYLHENPRLMITPMVALAAICAWIGIFPKTMAAFCLKAASSILPAGKNAVGIENILRPMAWITLSLGLLIGICLCLCLLRRLASKSLLITQSETWGCGYTRTTPRIQYTASSFASPILSLFREVLCLRRRAPKPKQIFPETVHVASEVMDASEHFFWRRIYIWMREICSRLKVIQCGYAQMYVLYIFIFLFLVLVWKVT